MSQQPSLQQLINYEKYNFKQKYQRLFMPVFLWLGSSIIVFVQILFSDNIPIFKMQLGLFFIFCAIIAIVILAVFYFKKLKNHFAKLANIYSAFSY